MNPLASLDIEIDEILDWHDGPSLFIGHDRAWRHYVAVQVGSGTTHRRWLCAAISRRALRCVLTGRADLRDALRHTPTGYVDVLTIDQWGRVVESQQLCGDLSDDALPAGGERLAMVA
jgi:hypothetical protein